MPTGSTLRILASEPFRLRWSDDGWQSKHDDEAYESGLGLFYRDFPLDEARQAPLAFTFYWPDREEWEGENYNVRITGSNWLRRESTDAKG